MQTSYTSINVAFELTWCQLWPTAPTEPCNYNVFYSGEKITFIFVLVFNVKSDLFITLTKIVREWNYQPNPNWHHNFQIATDEVLERQTLFNWSDGFSCRNQPMNFSPDALWIPSFLFTARLSGVSKVSLDRSQIVLCLSVCPWAPKGESGDSKRWRGKKSHSISRTDHWSGWLWHVMTQTASFLPLLSRRWPYKWSCRLPPYAIKHGVKQDGVLSPLICAAAPRHPLQRSLPALTFRKRKADYSGSFLCDGFVHILSFFFLSFLPCMCFIASCECWSEARSWSFPNRCLGAYRPRLCPYLWPSASCILSLACLRVGIYFT